MDNYWKKNNNLESFLIIQICKNVLTHFIFFVKFVKSKWITPFLCCPKIWTLWKYK